MQTTDARPDVRLAPSPAPEGHPPACPVCGARADVIRDDLYDDRYGYPGTHTLLGCRRCGHKFLGTRFTESELGALYGEYYPRGVLRLEAFKPRVELHGFRTWLEGEHASAFRWVPKNVRVLDVGCGFGETLAYHAARGCDAHGVDADPNLLRVAERYGLNARVGLFHAADYEPAGFDYVTLDQVIEHAADPRSFLRDVATVLRPGGVAIVTTPNSNGYAGRLLGRWWINWHVPYHLQHFSRRSLALLAEESGLEVVSIRTLTNSRWLHYQWMQLFTRPPEGVPSPFWDPKRSPRVLPKVPNKLGRLLYRARAFHVVTRVADASGVGDNFLCFLRKPT
jgi:2-polyprenyl-3-methyl-5-hydroxy-6-metoxy-1,4-benzoquinol methylase